MIDLKSRETIHAGVNFITAPVAGLDKANYLNFQAKLIELGINITNANYGQNQFIVTRTQPLPLEIRVEIVGPQVCQLLIIAPQPGANRSIEMVGAEANDVAQAFTELFGSPQLQILSCDADLRDLYIINGQHAFQEIWENRLKQPVESLSYFKRPVLGGGLRFVLPQTVDLPNAEIKIESFLQDTNKLFIETHLTWPQPQPPGANLDAEGYLCKVDDFIQHEVIDFLLERGGKNG